MIKCYRCIYARLVEGFERCVDCHFKFLIEYFEQMRKLGVNESTWTDTIEFIKLIPEVKMRQKGDSYDL